MNIILLITLTFTFLNGLCNLCCNFWLNLIIFVRIGVTKSNIRVWCRLWGWSSAPHAYFIFFEKSNRFDFWPKSLIYLTSQKPKFLSPKISQIYLTWASIFDFKNLNFESQTNLTFSQIYLTKLSNLFAIIIFVQKSQIFLIKVKRIWLF